MSNLQKFKDTLENFDKEVEQLKDVSGAYKKLKTLTENYGLISKHFEENSSELKKINDHYREHQELILKSLSALEKINEKNIIELGKILDEKTDQIRKENKEFYKEFEATLKIKLEENKSEIKHLIESERNQIKQIFEIEFSRNTKELRLVIEGEISKQTELLLKGQKGIKRSIIISAVIVVILSVLTLYKLMA